VYLREKSSCFLLIQANRYFVMKYRLRILSFEAKIDVERVSLTSISRDFTTTQMVSKLHKKVKPSKSVECFIWSARPNNHLSALLHYMSATAAEVACRSPRRTHVPRTCHAAASQAPNPAPYRTRGTHGSSSSSSGSFTSDRWHPATRSQCRRLRPPAPRPWRT
jgi:hypothetical protein